MSTKIHQLVDGAGLPLVVLVGPGQAGDAPMLPVLMTHLRVARSGRGRPRTRPERLGGDKAYSSRAIRGHLRSRGIAAVIPEPADQIVHRQRRGPHGGRPPAFDAADYKGRNVIERGINTIKQWRGLATRYDCDDEQVPPRGRGLTRVTTGLRCLVFDLSTARSGRCLLPSGRPGVSP